MITDSIAEKIVERTMAILNVNVNIMNGDGVIIGSGDVSRLGHVHAGAKRVLEEKRALEINEAESDLLSGSLPGINLPIHFQNQIVGVIGITGNPLEVHRFAEFVQMSAELILEQESVTKEKQRSNQMREEVLSQLLLGPTKELDRIVERAQSLQIQLAGDYAPILLSPLAPDGFDKRKEIENSILSLINTGDELIRLYTSQYVLLKKNQPNMNTDEKLTLLMREKLSKLDLTGLHITIGPFSSDVIGWRQAFEEAQTQLEVAENLYPNGGIWGADDLRVERMCYFLWKAAPEEAMKQVEMYKLIFQEKEGEILAATLQAYIRENGKAGETAKKLFIHRNTLTYRLEKIYQVTGKDPKNLHDLIELSIGRILYTLSDP